MGGPRIIARLGTTQRNSRFTNPSEQRRLPGLRGVMLGASCCDAHVLGVQFNAVDLVPACLQRPDGLASNPAERHEHAARLVAPGRQE